MGSSSLSTSGDEGKTSGEEGRRECAQNDCMCGAKEDVYIFNVTNPEDTFVNSQNPAPLFVLQF